MKLTWRAYAFGISSSKHSCSAIDEITCCCVSLWKLEFTNLLTQTALVQPSSKQHSLVTVAMTAVLPDPGGPCTSRGITLSLSLWLPETLPCDMYFLTDCNVSL